MSKYPNGYRPNGDGTDGATWGRDPDSGRAYTKAGTVRKARTAKDETAMLADLAERERKAQATIGRKVLTGHARFVSFMAAFAMFRAWVREARQYATDEAIEAKRVALEQAILDLNARQTAAQTFLAAQGDAIAQANGVFSSVGSAFIQHTKDAGSPPNEEQASAIIGKAINAKAIKAVESAANPDADPFKTFRRNQVESEESDDDGDTL
jgi:hypothetical protein